MGTERPDKDRHHKAQKEQKNSACVLFELGRCPGCCPGVAPGWSLDIDEPQRGSVPKPNVVPRLRDYVGLACQHDGNPNGVVATYIGARVDHYWSFGFTRMRSNGAMGRNPDGVDISFVPSTQGRRCAPTLGSVSERRWRSSVD